jgi:hypothetical protein
MAKKKMPKKCREAHNTCFKNWRLLKKSKMCGCFCCLNTYPASEVVDWCVERDRRRTAICPCCGVDSVIPDASGWPLDADFLKEMEYWWFRANAKSFKLPAAVAKKLNATMKKLNWLHQILPGAVFSVNPDGKIKLLGVVDPNSKKNIFSDLKDGGL